MIQIFIRNQSTLMTDAEVREIMEALQIQVKRDFVNYWPIADVSLVFLDKTQPEVPGVWELVVLDDSDQAGALGYHDLTSTGDPLGKVFVRDDLKFGNKVSVTMSHELLEILVDPSINISTELSSSTAASSSWYAMEVSDACEDDSFGYDIEIASGKKITVSDFVTPRWFSESYGQKMPYDFMKHITAAGQLLKNGYISINSGAGWSQILGETAPTFVAARAVPQVGHRRERRMRERSTWKISDRPHLES